MRKLKLLVGGLMIFIALFAISTGSAFADIVIKNGSTMKVSAGTEVIVSADVDLETGATLTNSGTFTVKGDFTNAGAADLGSGSFVFNGTAVQTIGGATISEFEDIEINNATGVGLSGSTQVDGTMTLTNGVFNIGGNNLTFGVAATAVVGTLSASTMIQADGIGQVRKAFTDGTSDPAPFLFTIGSVGEYSPIEINFNSSDFASAYVAVNVTASKETDNSSADNYLERYWTIVNFGITSYTYDLTATYVDADIIGTEADISGALYDGAGWLIGNPVTVAANTFFCDDFNDDGNATGVEFRILSDLTVIVQGAYRSVSDEMDNSLNSFGFLPLTAAEAYSQIGYGGTEAVTAIPSADVVDWILVEVRDAATPETATSATIAETVAGFLLQDGSIVGLDGVSPLPFKVLISNNAYFVIIHRNHLKIMTANSPTESFGSYSYDFTDDPNKAYGTSALIQVDTSPVVYGMYSGDVNASIFINNADKVPVDQNMGAVGYYQADCNLSVFVNNADKVPIDQNIGMFSQVPF